MDLSERRQQQVVGLLAAVTTVAWTAVPDWTTTPRQRRLVRAGVAVVGTSAAIAWSVVMAEPEPDVEDEPQPEPEDDSEDDSEDGPSFDLRAVAPVAAGVATSLVLARGAHVLERRMVRELERRGVRRPHTWVGVGSGIATLAVGPVERWLDGVSPDGPRAVGPAR